MASAIAATAWARAIRVNGVNHGFGLTAAVEGFVTTTGYGVTAKR